MMKSSNYISGAAGGLGPFLSLEVTCIGGLARQFGGVTPFWSMEVTCIGGLGITSARSTKLVLNIVMKTAVALLLGERREALSSTTRNHSSSQLQKGANQNRGPPTLNRDEDPC